MSRKNECYVMLVKHQHYVTSTASEKRSRTHTHTPEGCQRRKIQRERGVRPSADMKTTILQHTSALAGAIYIKHSVCVCVEGAVKEDCGKLVWQCVCVGACVSI